MPEGPEVLRCGSQLKSSINRKVLTTLKPLSGKLSRSMQEIIFNELVEDVIIKGKNIFIRLGDGREIHSTLGMSGWWYPHQDTVSDEPVVSYNQGRVKVLPSKRSMVKDAIVKHARVELKFSDGTSVFYVDARNFGNMKIMSTREAVDKRASLGIDMLDIVDGRQALAALRKQDNKEIGAVLLDQSVLCGFGNIYRAETLHLAGINPWKLIKTLSDFELRKIIDYGSYVLNVAYMNSGIMVYNVEVIKDSIPETSDNHITRYLVYGQTHDPLGRPVKSGVSGGRTIWYVHE